MIKILCLIVKIIYCLIMSLQDESFPDDELLEELNSITCNSRHFQFPINRVSLYKPTTSLTTNTSSSSNDQNSSSESGNDRPGSDLSGKTSASDPAGLAVGKSKNSEIQNKAFSYMDIHTEYTKRRYKHVESKVGQYIAKMKAEDQKLQTNKKKFPRHCSMPETIGRMEERDNLESTNRIRFSAVEIRKLDDSLSDAEADSSDNRSSRNQTESSDDVHNFDKQTFCQILTEKDQVQSYNNYLQIRLQDKSSEIVRLKQNLDLLRNELEDCKDKLKRRSGLAGMGSMNSTFGLYDGSNLSALGRQSTNQVFNQHQMKCSQATQTELITPSPLQHQQRLIICDLYTPESLDSNNNSFDNINCQKETSKSVAFACKGGNNILQQDHSSGQGVLRQRSNSNQMSQLQRVNSNSRRCYPSSSDSAFDTESIELQSPIGNRFRHERRTIRLNNLMNTTFIDLSPGNENIPNNSNNASSSQNITNTTDESNESNNQRNKQVDGKKKKKNKLRWRMIRLFGPCIGCHDVNTREISFTQVPLIETSPENHCRSER